MSSRRPTGHSTEHDETRRRVQQEQYGHRGRKADPLYRSGKLGQIGVEHLDNESLTKSHELLAAGDPNGEVLEAWAGKDVVRSTYDLDPEDAMESFDETIAAAKASPVPEVRRLGRTLKRWLTELLAVHTSSLSNGPVEGLNSSIKKLKRVAAGSKSFDKYGCRILLACGNINWQLLNPTNL